MSINNNMAQQWISDYYAGKSVGINTTGAATYNPLGTFYPTPPDTKVLEAQTKALEEAYKKALEMQSKKDFVISLDGDIEDTKTIFAQAMDAAREGYEVTIKVTK